MAMNTLSIIRHTERLDTICIRLARPADQDQRRQDLVVAFERMATELGKIASPCGRPDWHRVQTAMHNLRWAAVHADEARVATFAQLGTEAALVGSLHAFAAVLGLTLADAATAATDELDDDLAMAAVEGGKLEAAE